MPDTKSNRTDTSASSKSTSQALARDDRNRLQRYDSGHRFGDPFHFMDRMAEEMDRTFDRMFSDFGLPRRSWLTRSPFGSFGSPGSSQQQSLWAPRVEAFQKGDQFIVRAELPGLKKDDVQVEMGDDAITIHGERHDERKEDRDGYFHSERQYGEFYRTIPLPEGVIGESAKASFDNGVLEVTMQAPPAETRRGRRIEIEEGRNRHEGQEGQDRREGQEGKAGQGASGR
jgi:HSP20 family protein